LRYINILRNNIACCEPLSEVILAALNINVYKLEFFMLSWSMKPFAHPAQGVRTRPMAHRFMYSLVMMASVLLSACATVPGPADPRDPFQSTNRAVFKFNEALDDVAVKPAAQAYRFITPQFVRIGIHNFFSNLNEITVVVNDVLQGKASQGGKDALRFTMNTTVGLLGFIDVASHAGLEKHHEDFGLTLGHWGAESGPYLVLPLLGPSTVRDTVGLIPNTATGPYTLMHHVSPTHRYEGFALETIQFREALLNDEDLIDDVALSSDHYNLIRDAWLQRRRNQVYDGNPPADPYDLPDDAPAASPKK
jgi:phospholipid-binding lipoprotein MlaA